MPVLVNVVVPVEHRSVRIIRVLTSRGWHESSRWKCDQWTEYHFMNNRPTSFLKIIVRVHNNLNNMVEVFQVNDYFCAGNDTGDDEEEPKFSAVKHWAELFGDGVVN